MTNLKNPLRIGEKPMMQFTVKNHASVPINIIGVSGGTRLVRSADDGLVEQLDRCKKLAPHQSHEATLTSGSNCGFSTISQIEMTEETFADVMEGRQILQVFAACLFTDPNGLLRSSCTSCYYEPAHTTLFSIRSDLANNGHREEWDEIRIAKRPAFEFIRLEATDYTSGKPVGFKTWFRNNGGTEAINVALAYEHAFSKSYEGVFVEIAEKVGSMKCTPIGDVGALADFEARNVQSQVTPTDAHLEFAPEDRQLLYIWGRIEYADKGGGDHWTTFCLVFNGTECRPHLPLCKNDDNEYGEGDPKDAATQSTPPSADKTPQ